MPDWARELVTLYESGATSQFVLSGNVHDRVLLPLAEGPELGGLVDFVERVLLGRFDVVLRYDLGNGIRVERGEAIFREWPHLKQLGRLPKAPRPAVEALSHYFRYTANLARMSQRKRQVACIIDSANLVVPATGGALSYDLNALALLIRDWSIDEALRGSHLATFLITENVSDLHPLLVQNPRASRLEIGLPTVDDLEELLPVLARSHPVALAEWADDPAPAAKQLAGASLAAIEGLIRTRQHHGERLAASDLAALKRELVEREASGLIEFVEPDRRLDDYHGADAVVRWLRQDLELWRQDDLEAMPMGYLLCGPVGTGKTFLVECLAGEAAVPVVKFKNFRDRWVGSTESNLERIFRLLHALGRCIVFIDEADQALGRRNSSGDSSGVSGRVYSMMADEMSDTRNRGRILWVLASSRPDLIEVDLKRPGRIDVKLPLFPTSTPEQGFGLIRALAGKRGLELPSDAFERLRDRIPSHLTPGAAEALVVKIYRLTRTENTDTLSALERCLEDYRNPVARDVMDVQIELAVREATDPDFIPEAFRGSRTDA